MGCDFGIQSLQVKQGSIPPAFQVDTMVEVLWGMCENTAEKEIEQYRCEDTSLFNFIIDVKGSRGDTIGTGKELTSHIIMEKADDLCEFPWTAGPGEDDPLSLPVDHVEGLGQVNKDCIAVNLLFDAFLLDL